MQLLLLLLLLLLPERQEAGVVERERLAHVPLNELKLTFDLLGGEFHTFVFHWDPSFLLLRQRHLPPHSPPPLLSFLLFLLPLVLVLRLIPAAAAAAAAERAAAVVDQGRILASVRNGTSIFFETLYRSPKKENSFYLLAPIVCLLYCLEPPPPPPGCRSRGVLACKIKKKKFQHTYVKQKKPYILSCSQIHYLL